MSSKVCMILVWFFVICLLVVGLVMVSSLFRPWKPATTTTRLRSSSEEIRSVSRRLMRALV